MSVNLFPSRGYEWEAVPSASLHVPGSGSIARDTHNHPSFIWRLAQVFSWVTLSPFPPGSLPLLYPISFPFSLSWWFLANVTFLKTLHLLCKWMRSTSLERRLCTNPSWIVLSPLLVLLKWPIGNINHTRNLCNNVYPATPFILSPEHAFTTVSSAIWIGLESPQSSSGSFLLNSFFLNLSPSSLILL